MGAPDLLHALRDQGFRLWVEGDRLLVAPKERITDETRTLIRAHRAELLAVLVPDPLPDPAAEARQQALAEPERFTFSPPGDPANDDEAVAERAAIIAVENGWSDAQALQEARWQADRERCWRAFLRNAGHVLAAPEGERSGLLTIYAAEASRRYGERTGADMAASLRGWVNARAVH